MKAWVFAVSLLFWSTLGLAAQQNVHTIELQHQSAEQVLPVLRPLLPAGCTVSGHGGLLFLRADLEQMQQVRRVIERLDRVERGWQVTVRVDSGGLSHREGGGIDTDEGPPPRVKVYDTRQLRGTGATYRVRTSDNRWAQLAFGRQIPIPVLSAHGGSVMQGIEYHTVGSGLQVRTQRLGDGRVQLTVRPYRQRTTGGDGAAIAFEQLATTLTLEPGQWRALGYVNDRGRAKGWGITHSTRDLREQQTAFFIRVDPAP